MELSLIYSYYDNPHMLARQLEEWSEYPTWVKQRLEVIITDDCSAKYSLRNHIYNVEGVQLRGFRITQDIPWNWLACRNIGALKACGRWLLVTDIDHVVLKWDMMELMKRLIGQLLDERTAYVFTRRRADSGNMTTSHGNSYLLTRDLYWRAGGYNEQYSGNYWNTSGTFRKQLHRKAKIDVLELPLTLFTREDIPDAESVLPKTGKAKRSKEIKTLTFPYEEVAW